MSLVPKLTATTLYSEVNNDSLQGTLSRPLLCGELVDFARLREADFC